MAQFSGITEGFSLQVLCSESGMQLASESGSSANQGHPETGYGCRNSLHPGSYGSSRCPALKTLSTWSLTRRGKESLGVHFLGEVSDFRVVFFMSSVPREVVDTPHVCGLFLCFNMVSHTTQLPVPCCCKTAGRCNKCCGVVMCRRIMPTNRAHIYFVVKSFFRQW